MEPWRVLQALIVSGLIAGGAVAVPAQATVQLQGTGYAKPDLLYQRGSHDALKSLPTRVLTFTPAAGCVDGPSARACSTVTMRGSLPFAFRASTLALKHSPHCQGGPSVAPCYQGSETTLYTGTCRVTVRRRVNGTWRRSRRTVIRRGRTTLYIVINLDREFWEEDSPEDEDWSIPLNLGFGFETPRVPSGPTFGTPPVTAPLPTRRPGYAMPEWLGSRNCRVTPRLPMAIDPYPAIVAPWQNHGIDGLIQAQR